MPLVVKVNWLKWVLENQRVYVTEPRNQLVDGRAGSWKFV